MSPLDSWESAIVRHRDGRKGRVLQDGRNRLNREHRLLVHWDDDTLDDVAAATVTMLRPPIGYRDEVAPMREDNPLERLLATRWGVHFIILVGLIGIAAVAIPTVLAILDLLGR